MTSGANSHRISLIINKYAKLLNASVDFFMTHKVFILTITDVNTGEKITETKSLPHFSINFKIISALSRGYMSAKKEKWNKEEILNEVKRIEKLKHYPRLTILIGVSAAGAGFCNLFGGDYINMLVAFIATFAGLFVRQEVTKRGYNHNLCVCLAAFVSSLIAAIFYQYNMGAQPQIAIATSVLYLIPGVPLINSFTDMMDGYIINGVIRLINGIMFIFSIAIAMFAIMFIFNIDKI